MRVLVTGGGGFLGREVVKQLLERGESVRILGRQAQPELASQGVEVVLGDIAQTEKVSQAVQGCDAVIHTAAKAGVWGGWQEYYQPNVVGTQNVLDAMRRHRVAKLAYTSTPSVVFNGESHAGLDETQPIGTKFPCHYPHTKAIAERLLMQAHNGDSMRAIALRPHLIWGAGDPHLVPRILDRAHQLRIVGEGKNRVDLTHVSNAAKAHILALDALETPGHPAAGKAFFISDGAPVLLWDWINELLTRLGKPPITRHISLRTASRIGLVAENLWRLLPILPGEPPMTRFVATELAKDHWYNITAARQKLQYKPENQSEKAMEALIARLSRCTPKA